MASPIVSVDADPLTLGVQPDIDVAPGVAFSIAVVIEAVDPAEPLQVFELDLDFDPALFTALAVRQGGFLLGDPLGQGLFPPFGTLVFAEDLAPPAVAFGVSAVGTSTSAGGGVLATIDFQALALAALPSLPVSSLLDLNDVVLGTGTGSEARSIAGVTVADAGVAVVPVPGTLSLFALGLWLLGRPPAARCRRRAASWIT